MLAAWLRRHEIGLIALAVPIGAVSGGIAAGMGEIARLMHIGLFGPGGGHGLSAIRTADPLILLLVPALGGLILGLLNRVITRRRPRQPIDPIEANALHGGRMSLNDAIVVAVQNLVSNGFGASVGMEAAYAQAGGSLASRLGRALDLRRGDLRILVGCGTAGAIAAAFNAPLTGAFYAFELVIGTYAVVTLGPVMAGAVAGSLAGSWLGGGTTVLEPQGIAPADWSTLLFSLALGAACALAAIGLMRGVGLVEAVLRRLVPWTVLRPAAGGLVVGALALVTPSVLSAGHAALHLTFVLDNTAGPLIALLLLKSVASAVSIGSGFRGGLFFASLLLGALLGKLCALGIALAGVQVDSLMAAIIGMSAFGTAIIGAPLAMAFIALETTRDFGVAGPVMIGVIVSAALTRRLFGYSFATWRFHLRGESIRSAHDIGWLRDLSVGRMMRRETRTVRSDSRLPAFRRDFPLGATERVVVLDNADHYAGVVLLAEAHAHEADELDTIAPLLHLQDRILRPQMSAKEAMETFDATNAEALAVVDGDGKVLGLLTVAHLLRRYSEELDKRRREESGLPAGD